MPKRDEVTGKRSRVYNENLYDLYSSTNIIRAIKLTFKNRASCI